ncbi:SH3-containing GRB2-like protein 3-interacting protein 1 [Arapaima gigas]
MMEGLKKRTRKAFGIRKKERDTDSTGSPDKDGGSQKRTNGAPNGFHGEIDWERYNSPEVDDEGYSIRPEDEDGNILYKAGPNSIKHFYSSSESEEEEDHRRRFNIKIKPLAEDSSHCTAPSVDELRASVGNIALSPSPLVSCCCSIVSYAHVLIGEEIARPRRSTPTPALVSSAPLPPMSPKIPDDPATLFGPPLETAFDEHKSAVVIDEPEVWGGPTSEPQPDSSMTRPFPTGTPPPLPPKNVPSVPPPCATPPPDVTVPDTKVCAGNEDQEVAPESLDADTQEVSKKASMADLDNIFGPVKPPRSAEDTADSKWVSFSDESPETPPPPTEPAPPPPTVPPPDSPLTVTPGPVPSLDPGTPTALLSDPYASPPPLAEKPPGTIPPPLVLNEEDRKSCEAFPPKDDLPESTASPKEFGPSPRATPPPPPPPTYRAVVSSPGPCSGTGSGSGSSSPARPATPLAASSPTPPPPPPRPSSRPKLPPGKPSIGDIARPFSPPVNSSSPPPMAPLARAESTSSISSTNSLSAATTPTVGKEFSLSVSENDQPSLVWFDRGKFYLTFEGCSRGPSPLTMGAQDTLPVAAAFTETVNAYFKGADPSKCVVKITGEMVLSFPAGITRHFANNPSPAVLTFSITNYNRLEHVLPNPQLLCCDTIQPNGNSKEFWVNMPNLMTHLKKVADQKPQATYYNVDMLKYQVSTNGIQSTPLNLAVSWRCDSSSTDLRIDYKYNSEAMTTPVALNNVQFLVPVDGGVTKLQTMLPPAAWNAEQQRILWKIPDISQKSDNGGVGSLLGRFQVTEGPSKPSPLAVQFTSEGSTLSGCDIELVGAGYRFSLVKRRFTAGKYLAEN